MRPRVSACLLLVPPILGPSASHLPDVRAQALEHPNTTCEDRNCNAHGVSPLSPFTSHPSSKVRPHASQEPGLQLKRPSVPGANACPVLQLSSTSLSQFISNTPHIVLGLPRGLSFPGKVSRSFYIDTRSSQLAATTHRLVHVATGVCSAACAKLQILKLWGMYTASMARQQTPPSMHGAAVPVLRNLPLQVLLSQKAMQRLDTSTLS